MDMLLLWVDGPIVNTLLKRNVTLDKLSQVEVNMRPIPPGLVDKVWLPDVLFEEVVHVNKPVVLDKSTTVLFNPKMGAVYIRAKIFVTLNCNMDLFYYPADTQRCQFHMRSGSHTSAEVNIDWWRNKGYGVYLHETSDPNFDLRVASISKADRPVDFGPETQARNLSSLQFEIHIRRKMSYHLVQTYLPSVFFIVVTWLCFLIPSGMLEVRIGVTMTTLLTLTSMFSSIRENTTVVSYVKAIDIWMVACIAFIFVVLLAFTTEAWFRAAKRRLQGQKDSSNEDENTKDKSKDFRSLQAYIAIEGYLDRFAALALFSSFLIFNILYWSWLLINSEHLNWLVDETFNKIQ